MLNYLNLVLNLVGTKYGCGISQCGACTIHIEGDAVRSCVYPISELGNQKITTIEGLSDENEFNFVQKAWIKEDVSQCGYCQAGQIMAATALLKKIPNPSDQSMETLNNFKKDCSKPDYYQRTTHIIVGTNRKNKTS